MAKFAIMRIKKLKNAGAVGASLAHAFRERETPNADPSRKDKNQYIGARSTDEAMGRFRSRLPEKIRKNGVQCLEYLITASPDSLSGSQWPGYLNKALDFFKELHGAKNVICASVHRDEKTPHMSIFVVPLDERGKLNARSFTGGSGGPEGRLSQLQSDFWKVCGEPFGLDRGIPGSRAKHQTIEQFYGKIEELDKAITPPPPKKGETEEAYKKRYKAQLAPLLANAAIADQLQKRNKELEDQMVRNKAVFNSRLNYLDGLTPEQQSVVDQQVKKFRAENRQKKSQRRDNDRGL
jgi:hypothetical protein